MIGDLRHRLILQQRTRTPDGAGGFSEVWADLSADAVVYAAIQAVGGAEGLRTGRRQGVQSYRIVLRWRSDVTADMRLTDGQRVYDISSALDRDGRKQYLEVMATSEG